MLRKTPPPPLTFLSPQKTPRSWKKRDSAFTQLNRWSKYKWKAPRWVYYGKCTLGKEWNNCIYSWRLQLGEERKEHSLSCSVTYQFFKGNAYVSPPILDTRFCMQLNLLELVFMKLCWEVTKAVLMPTL